MNFTSQRTPHKPQTYIHTSEPKPTSVQTPESSNKSDDNSEEEKHVEVDVSEDSKSMSKSYKKRRTVVHIAKAIDPKRAILRKMLLLNTLSDNMLTRPPVFAWENEEKGEDSQKQGRLLCITWNMQGTTDDFPSNLHELVKREIQHDFFAIAVQNCSNFTKWEKAVMSVLGDAYSVLVHSEYRGLGLSLICRKKVRYLQSGSTQTDHYRDNSKHTNVMAIGVTLGKTKIAFVNCNVDLKIFKETVEESSNELPILIEIDQTLNMGSLTKEEKKG